MWAQLVRMRSKPDMDAAEMIEQIRATDKQIRAAEHPGEGESA
jgi:hypothetical protein